MSDKELVALYASSGDPQVFNEIYNRHVGYVKTYCNRYLYLYYSADIEDAVQDVFVSVANNIKSFRGEAKFKTWLHRIVYVTCMQIHRKGKQPKGAILQHAFRFEHSDYNIDTCKQLGVEAKDIKQLDVEIDLKLAWDLIPKSLREIVYLKYIQDVPYNVLCKHYGISLAAAKARVFRGIKIAKESLALMQEV